MNTMMKPEQTETSPDLMAMMMDLVVIEGSATDSAAAEDAKRIVVQRLRDELIIQLETLGAAAPDSTAWRN